MLFWGLVIWLFCLFCWVGLFYFLGFVALLVLVLFASFVLIRFGCLYNGLSLWLFVLLFVAFGLLDFVWRLWGFGVLFEWFVVDLFECL